MKKYLSMVAIMIAVTVNVCAQTAQQNFPGFTVTKDGLFLAEDGRNYIIYPFEGKTAKEIYTQICANVAKVYKSPQKVMSSVEDASVAIRAYAKDILFQKSYLGMYFFYEGFYNLLIEIKEGRVKVNAPSFDIQTGQAGNTKPRKTSAEILSDYFDKEGKLREKRVVWKSYAEHQINSIYEMLLGAGGAASKSEDW